MFGSECRMSLGEGLLVTKAGNFEERALVIIPTNTY